MTDTTTAPVIDAMTLRIEGVATLLSSLSHGGDKAGTTGFLRRERIVGPDGQMCEIPIVTGNAFRGLLRDHAAHVFWSALGRPHLPLPVFHLLWSGGSLAKAGSGHVLGARQLQQVRAMVPVVSLFGGSGAGKIIEGKLSVGKLTPICAETAHLLPDAVTGETPPPTVWDLVQIEEFTRRDDSKRDQLHAAIGGLAELGTGDQALTGVEAHDQAVEAVDGPAQQMRYGIETLAAGTRLHWWIQLRNVTAVERALFGAAVESWTADGAHIGGRSATGHGRLRLDISQWAHQAPTVTVGESLAIPGGDPLADHVAAHRAEITEALGWFA